MTDSSQSIQSQFSYDPWGVPTQIAGTGATPDFGYASYYLDTRSSLNLTRTRAYSAVLARFLSRDPIGELMQGATLYGYVQNDPVLFRDPFGLCPLLAPPTGLPKAENPFETVVDTEEDNNNEDLTAPETSPQTRQTNQHWPEPRERPDIPEYLWPKGSDASDNPM